MSKLAKASATKPLLSDGPSSPTAVEKNAFRIPQTYLNQPSSYVSSSPPPSSYNPSSPAPSAAVLSPHMLANSPQQPLRPTSTVSSTSAALTSFYTSGAPTSEGGFQGYYPQPPPPQQQQQYQQQYQQQPVGVAPAWAHPEPTSSPPPTHMQHTSVPSPSQSPAPVVISHPLPSASPAPAPAPSFPPEKAQYMPRPEKSVFSGVQADQSTAGASSSSPPVPTGASGSGPTAHSGDILTTPVPELPPPAYQL